LRFSIAPRQGWVWLFVSDKGVVVDGATFDNLQSLFGALDDGVIVLDAHDVIVAINRVGHELLGNGRSPVGTPLRHWLEVHKWGGAGQVIGERKDRPHRYIQVSEFPGIPSPTFKCVLLRRSAEHTFGDDQSPKTDPVTKMLSATGFQEGARAVLAAASLETDVFALVLVKIDSFSSFNEIIGRDLGDQFLSAIAGRVVRAIPLEGMLARLGGGEFAALIPGITQNDQHLMIFRNLHRSIEQPISVAGTQRMPTVSIGVAFWPKDGDDLSTLLTAAHFAAHTASIDGGGRTRCFDPTVKAAALERLSLERELRQAIERHEFEVYYQPKINCRSGEMVGMEALVRWNHPKSGRLSPDKFIPIAEASGLIVALGRSVLEQVARQIAEWQSMELDVPPVAVNVSPLQLLNQSTSELLSPLLRNNVPRHLVEIEITETAALDVLRHSPHRLHETRAAGFSLAIDDFGAGHSSLATLRKLPFDVLKIDKALLDDAVDSLQAREIVGFVLAMAKGLSLNVVAEGVEHHRQAEVLDSLGATIMQGYLFSPPVPASVMTSWLVSRHHWDVPGMTASLWVG